MRREYWMIVSPYPGKADPQCSILRIPGNRPATINDELRAIGIFCRGRQYWSPWQGAPKNIRHKTYAVFRGEYINGRYRGRASDYSVWYVACPEPEPNTNLIAAAPDLLACCQEELKALDARIHLMNPSEVNRRDALRDAIKKATGV